MNIASLRRSFLTPALCVAAGILLSSYLTGAVNAYIQNTMIYVLVNMVLALGLNLVNGFTGQFSLGNAGFMAVGAYVSAWISFQLPPIPGFLEPFAFPLYAIAGGLVAAAAGLAVGLPSLRLKGDYLAIVTLGFGEIIRVILLNTESVGGARGYYGIVAPSNFFWSFFWSFMWVCITTIVLWRLVKSTHGRCFMSVREDELAAELMGINTTAVKVRAFILSSFFAGVAGSMFAHYTQYLNPATFSFVKSVDSVIMVILGGMGSLSGSLIAAVIITVLPEVLRPLQEITGVDLRMVIYSLLLVLMMLTRPKGLMGSKEIFQLWRKNG